MFVAFFLFWKVLKLLMYVFGGLCAFVSHMFKHLLPICFFIDRYGRKFGSNLEISEIGSWIFKGSRGILIFLKKKNKYG